MQGCKKALFLEGASGHQDKGQQFPLLTYVLMPTSDVCAVTGILQNEHIRYMTVNSWVNPFQNLKPAVFRSKVRHALSTH